ncbi:MAG: Omp28 family outer membrane lipoprotein [Prevotella sp.]|nr:Omp28 family outer membrane lipoprotein [Prevotella sp.]
MKIYFYAFSAIVAAVTLAACSNIDEDERLIYVQPADVAKHVLIEDFTGQACVNCPAASELIAQMQEEYGEENIIAVGLYSGSFGQNIRGDFYPLTTELGNYYYNLYGVSEQPSAMIDRHGVNSNYATWPAEVYNCIQDSAKVKLDITNSYDEATRTADITVSALAVKDISGTLQVWLTEDNIVNWQYLSDGSADAAYVHNHVFRTAVNDRDGDTFNVSEGTTQTRTFCITLDEDWAAENVSAVAIVSDAGGVVQSVKAPIIAKDEDDSTEQEAEEEENDNE